MKTTTFRFSVDGKHFDVTITTWFSARVFLKHKSKMAGYYDILKLLQRGVDEKHLMRFQSETFVIKFLRRSADGASTVLDVRRHLCPGWNASIV